MNSIRSVHTNDLDALSRLFEAYRKFYLMNPEPEMARTFLLERISKKDSVIFVLVSGETLIGFVQLYPLFSSTRMKPLWLLNDLFIVPSERGKGLSKQLIERCKQLCVESGACGLTLETARSNDIGNRLYLKTGFRLVHENSFYYWNV